MITQATKRVPCTEQEAQNLPAYHLGGTWANGYLEFSVNVSNTPDLRMVHNNTKVLAIIEGEANSITESIYTLFEGKDMYEIQGEIDRLGLEPLPEDQMPPFIDLDQDGKADRVLAGTLDSGRVVTEDADSYNILEDGKVTVVPKA